MRIATSQATRLHARVVRVSAKSGSVGLLIRLVLEVSSPSEILRGIVQPVTIVVTSLHTTRARAYVHFQYSARYAYGMGSAIIPEQFQVAVSVRGNGYAKHLALPVLEYASVIAKKIPLVVGKTRNLLPHVSCSAHSVTTQSARAPNSEIGENATIIARR